LTFLSPDDRAAVRWLADQNGPNGRAVIAEGVGDEYDWSAGAPAPYSGAATVLGGAGHELQWRGPLSELSARQNDLAALYLDAPVDGIRAVIDRYAVRFIVVRDLERKKYGDAVASRFESV